MGEILKSLSLSFLLRSVFAGTFFVLAYWVATNGTCKAIEIDSGNIFSVGLVFALVAGVNVYGVHRSVVFPLIEWALNSNWAMMQRRRGRTLISENTIRNLVKRWDLRAVRDEQMHYRAEQIVVWADYVHLQYASAWCIVLGSITGMTVAGRWHLPHWRVSAALVVFLFAAASVSAWRSHSVEEKWKVIEEVPLKPESRQ